MIRLFSIVVPARVFTLFLSEIVLLFACFVAAAFADPDIGDAGIFLAYDSGVSRIGIVVAFVVVSLFFNNQYAEVRIRSRMALLQSLCLIFGVAFIGQGMIGYLDPNWIIPRKMMLTGTVLSVAALFGWRLLFDRAARHAVAAGRVLFLGMSPTVAKIAGHFAKHPELGLTSIGYLEGGTPAASSMVLRLGTMEDLDGVLDQSVPDAVVIGNREDIRPWWVDEFLALRFGGVQVQEAGTLYERIFARKCVTEIRPSKAIFAGASQLGSLDISLQSLYSPALAVVAAIVTLPVDAHDRCPDPNQFPRSGSDAETRIGLHDAPFEAYRFRCVGRDGKYTPVGRFLRRHGLVWFPQLINVLKGDMAMVGPRPERPVFARRMSELIPVYRQRHFVKPGVTGWARIHRRTGIQQDSMRDLEYDLYYLENLSPLLDFFILLLSLKTVEPGFRRIRPPLNPRRCPQPRGWHEEHGDRCQRGGIHD